MDGRGFVDYDVLGFYFVGKEFKERMVEKSVDLKLEVGRRFRR